MAGAARGATAAKPGDGNDAGKKNPFQDVLDKEKENKPDGELGGLAAWCSLQQGRRHALLCPVSLC